MAKPFKFTKHLACGEPLVAALRLGRQHLAQLQQLIILCRDILQKLADGVQVGGRTTRVGPVTLDLKLRGKRLVVVAHKLAINDAPEAGLQKDDVGPPHIVQRPTRVVASSGGLQDALECYLHARRMRAPGLFRVMV